MQPIRPLFSRNKDASFWKILYQPFCSKAWPETFEQTNQIYRISLSGSMTIGIGIFLCLISIAHLPSLSAGQMADEQAIAESTVLTSKIIVMLNIEWIKMISNASVWLTIARGQVSWSSNFELERRLIQHINRSIEHREVTGSWLIQWSNRVIKCLVCCRFDRLLNRVDRIDLISWTS